MLAKLNISDTPGVYIFKDANKRPLYIGRATSLKDRVKSYFGDDLIETRGPRIVDMVTKAKSLDWRETDSVLEAIILESNLIKKYQPRYNIDEKDDKSDQYVIITNEEWPRVFLERARNFELDRKEGTIGYEVKKAFGSYPSGGLMREALKILRCLFPFKDKKARDPRHDSFYKAMGKSPEGDDEKALGKYEETIKNLILFFDGKKKILRKSLERRMNEHAAKMEFEDAGRIKRLLYTLNHINDIALIKANRDSRMEGGGDRISDFRMEAYDIAHLSGTNTVGAVTVSIGGELAKNEYRKFKIAKDKNDDLRNLAEILTRRLNHSEWNYPDLIVVDGNEMQAKVAESVLKARRIGIPVVAVTKNKRHKAAKILGDESIVRKHKTEIIALNAEAHRFAIAYHRKLRKRDYEAMLASSGDGVV